MTQYDKLRAAIDEAESVFNRKKQTSDLDIDAIINAALSFTRDMIPENRDNCPHCEIPAHKTETGVKCYSCRTHYPNETVDRNKALEKLLEAVE